MSKPFLPDYSQMSLLPPALEDWIGQEHPARFIRDFTAQIDYKECGFPLPSPNAPGQPPFHPQVLLSILLFGMLKKVDSSRALEERCKNDIGFIWLCGQRAPDHNTLANFLKKHAEPIKKAFAQSVHVARAAGLVADERHALDGTRIPCAASTRTCLDRKQLQKDLKEAEEAIAHLLEQPPLPPVGELSADWQDPHRRKEQIEQELRELQEADSKHLHPREPEARMMKLGDGRTRLGYNCQASVDEACQIVVAAEVVSEASDNNLLAPMIEQARQSGSQAQVTVADGGYFSGRMISAAEQQGVDVFTPAPLPTKEKHLRFHKSRFVYDPERDLYRCPEGRELSFERVKDGCRQYRCGTADCPFRSLCCRGKGLRTVERTVHDTAIERMESRHSEDRSSLLSFRRQSVEPLFGYIKRVLGFTRMRSLGLCAARAQWFLVCLAYNLRKLMLHAPGCLAGQERLKSRFSVLAMDLPA